MTRVSIFKKLCAVVGGVSLLLLMTTTLSQGGSLSFDFTFENDGTLPGGPFGTLVVHDNVTDKLHFTVATSTSLLGPNADIEQFGFNLNYVGTATILPEVPGSPGDYSGVTLNDKVKGRNSFFDYVVDFGQGGNKYSQVSFFAKGTGLDLNALSGVGLDLSTQNNKPSAHFMMHVQNTVTSIQSTSEVVGGTYNARPPDPVPEPTTLLLFSTGLAGLFALKRKKRK